MDSTSIKSPIIADLQPTLNSKEKFSRGDLTWALSLYGTAIGAGVLFLPIEAGISGLIPVLLMTLLAFPMTFLAHRNLSRFVLSGQSDKSDLTHVVEEHFGKTSGNWVTFFYFFAIYPILLVYSVSLTNNVENIISNLLGYNAPPRWLLAFILVGGLILLVNLGRDWIVKTISFLVFPFIIVLMLFSFAMIPYWTSAPLQTLSFSYVPATEHHHMLTTIWLTLPLMIFSFNHSPIISSFSVANRQKYGINAEKKCSKILGLSTTLMVVTALFFVYSCIFTLSPAELAAAKAANLSILDYLSIHFHQPLIKYVAAFIAFIAIIKSFLGHYLGAREGIHGLILRICRHKNTEITPRTLDRIAVLFFFITTWLVATLNPNILNIIESLGGPIIALILFLMPVYAIYRIPALAKYKQAIPNIFITIIGFIAITAAIYLLIP